jgi:CheY-like chemotaxis protein/DNA-directed RNA polymerase subunit RPC12/RpoP
MKCPKCKTSITQSFDPDSIVTCPGCGSRLMTRATALRSQGGRSRRSAPAPVPDPEGTVPTIHPAKAGEEHEKADAPESAAPAPAPPADAPAAGGSIGTAATLDEVLRELQMLRATQLQILDLVGRGKSVPQSSAAAPDDTQILSPIRARRQKTVLLVDDDPKTSEAAVKELTQADVPVRSVDEGNAALAAIAEEKPDVIILELGLGGEMGGKDLINMIKATMEWVDVPIILWTREAVSTQKEARQEHGADELVTKKSGAGALVTRVITVFRGG